MIHTAIELWYRSQNAESRLNDILVYINDAFENRIVDLNQMTQWHLATAMIRGYAERYSTEEFEVVEVEKEFVGEIRNPILAGKAKHFESLGRSMASSVATMVCICSSTRQLERGCQLSRQTVDRHSDRLCNCYYLRELGYPIVGVIYNVLLKSRLKQGKGETQDEYEARKSELATKNKSGKSNAKRQMPEDRR